MAELPALRRYDDEEVTELDRELAAESTGGTTNTLQLPRGCAASFTGLSVSQVTWVLAHLLTDRRLHPQQAAVSLCLSEYQLRNRLRQRYIGACDMFYSVLQKHDKAMCRLLALYVTSVLIAHCFAGALSSSR